jgi:AcrR family transcriptional regulator
MLTRGAVVVVERHGWIELTHTRVAAACGCSPRTVYRWAKDRKMLREQVKKYARDRGLMSLLAEAVELSI